MTLEEFDKKLKKARKTNAERDAIEAEHNFASPTFSSPYMGVDVAIEAITAGLIVNGEDCFFEAIALLEVVREQLKQERN